MSSSDADSFAARLAQGKTEMRIADVPTVISLLNNTETIHATLEHLAPQLPQLVDNVAGLLIEVPTEQGSQLLHALTRHGDLNVRRAVVESGVAQDLTYFATSAISSGSETIALRALASINALVTPTVNDDVDAFVAASSSERRSRARDAAHERALTEAAEADLEEEYDLIQSTKLEVRKGRVVHVVRALAAESPEKLTPRMIIALATLWSNVYANRTDGDARKDDFAFSEVDAGVHMLKTLVKALDAREKAEQDSQSSDKAEEPSIEGGAAERAQNSSILAATATVAAAFEKLYAGLGEQDLVRLLDDALLMRKLALWLGSADTAVAAHAAGVVAAFSRFPGLTARAFSPRGGNLAAALETLLGPQSPAHTLRVAAATLVAALGSFPALAAQTAARGTVLRAGYMLNHTDYGVRLAALELIRAFAPHMVPRMVDEVLGLGTARFLVDCGEDIIAVRRRADGRIAAATVGSDLAAATAGAAGATAGAASASAGGSTAVAAHAGADVTESAAGLGAIDNVAVVTAAAAVASDLGQIAIMWVKAVKALASVAGGSDLLAAGAQKVMGRVIEAFPEAEASLRFA